MRKYVAAAAAFAETLERLGPPATRDSPALGRRAAVLIVADSLWRSHLGPLLQARDVQELLGVTRQAVSDFRKRGRLLGLPAPKGQFLYPAFQFDGPKIRPEIAPILRALQKSGASAHTLASWFQTPQRALSGATPAERMQAGGGQEQLVTAALRTTARLTR